MGLPHHSTSFLHLSCPFQFGIFHDSMLLFTGVQLHLHYLEMPLLYFACSNPTSSRHYYVLFSLPFWFPWLYSMMNFASVTFKWTQVSKQNSAIIINYLPNSLVKTSISYISFETEQCFQQIWQEFHICNKSSQISLAWIQYQVFHAALDSGFHRGISGSWFLWLKDDEGYASANKNKIK